MFLPLSNENRQILLNSIFHEKQHCELGLTDALALLGARRGEGGGVGERPPPADVSSAARWGRGTRIFANVLDFEIEKRFLSTHDFYI